MPDNDQQPERRGNRLETEAEKTIRRRFEELERRLAAVERPRPNPDEFERVLLAAANSNGTWSELTISNGTFQTIAPPDGRGCTSTSDPSRIMKLTGNQTALLEIEDAKDNYYVPITLIILVKIVSSTGNAWTGCTYTVQDAAGNTYTAFNALEPCGGSPGPLGVNVSSSNGTVNSGTCVVKPLGPTTRYFPMWWDSVNSQWTFAIANSAQ